MSAMLSMRVLEQGGKFVQCIKYVDFTRHRCRSPTPTASPLNKDDKRILEEVVRTMNKTISNITGAAI